MQTYLTLFTLLDQDRAHVQQAQTILFEGRWWMVGDWIETSKSGKRIPCNMLLLSELPHQVVEGQPFRFVLTNPIPVAVLKGKSLPGYTVMVHPEAMQLDGPKSVN